jgi:predicted MFS family arabinose efflux permease
VLVQGLLAGILAVLAFTGRLTVPAVAIISFLNGCAATLSNPAFSALIADSVPPEDLHSALSLNSAQFNVGRIVGPTLAALVLATLGMAWALLINTVSFLAVLVALACVHTAPHAAKKLEGLWDGIVHGVRVAFEDPEISKALGGTLVVAALVAPFIGLVPVYALRIFHQEAATSLLVAMQGAGAVTAALSVGSLVERMGRQRLLQWVMLLIGPMAAWYWLTPSISAAAAAIFGLGALYMMMVTGFHTVCQLRASRELQARVSSLFSMVLGAGYSAGVWLQGALADRIGLRLVTVSSALLFLALVLSWRLLRPRDVQATGA